MTVADLQAILAKCQPEDQVSMQAGPAFPGNNRGGWYGAEWVTRMPNGAAKAGPFVTIYARGTKRTEMDLSEIEVTP